MLIIEIDIVTFNFCPFKMNFFKQIRESGTVPNIAMLSVATAALGLGGISTTISAIRGVGGGKSALMILFLLLIGVLMMAGAVVIGYFPLRESIRVRRLTKA